MFALLSFSDQMSRANGSGFVSGYINKYRADRIYLNEDVSGRYNKQVSVHFSLSLMTELYFPSLSPCFLKKKRGYCDTHRPSGRTYARYILRLAFEWLSVYSIIVGLKIDKNMCCWDKEDQRKIKGMTS